LICRAQGWSIEAKPDDNAESQHGRVGVLLEDGERVSGAAS